MRNLQAIEQLRDEMAKWDYSDDPECADALWAQGAMVALKHVLGFPEAEREAKTLEYYNTLMTYKSYGDDDNDYYQCGKQETAAFCLNRIERYLHLSIADLRADTSGHDDHQFRAIQTPDRTSFFYVCESCGWRELPAQSDNQVT